MDTRSIFAERFKELRNAAGLKQSEIGERLGVSRGTISFYENCDRVPDIGFIARAAEYFQVSSDWMLGRKGAIKDISAPHSGDFRYLYLIEKNKRQAVERACGISMEQLLQLLEEGYLLCKPYSSVVQHHTQEEAKSDKQE